MTSWFAAGSSATWHPWTYTYCICILLDQLHSSVPFVMCGPISKPIPQQTAKVETIFYICILYCTVGGWLAGTRPSVLCSHSPTVWSSLVCVVKAPRCWLVGTFWMGITQPNPKSLPRLLISTSSKPARLVIGLLCSKPSWRPTGRCSACGSVWAQGSQDSLSLFINGGSNVLAPLPRGMSVLGLAAVTEKRHKYWLCVLCLYHTRSVDRAMCSPGLRILPSLSLFAGECRQTTEPWCRAVTGVAVCKVLGWEKRETKEASGVVLSHHGCSAHREKASVPTPPQKQALDCARVARIADH